MTLKNNLLLLSFALTFSSIYAQETHRLEGKARDWIAGNASKTNLNPQTNYKLNNSRSSATGETLRFQQTINGVPIFEGDMVVHFNKHDVVTYTADAPVSKKMISIDTNPKVSLIAAFDIAKEAIQPKGEIMFEENKLYVYNTDDGEARLVYRVVIDSFEKVGSWEAIVDAHTREIVSIKDIAVYHHHKKNGDETKKVTVKNNRSKASGTAYIYNPDPLSVAGVQYGGQYVDGNDATNPSLDAARSLVNLPEIEFANNVYKLKSKYAEIKEIQAPATGLFTQASPDFLFDRSQLGFEATNIFYHFHNNLAYINETLGIVCKPTVNGGVVQFDPHGQNGADNSGFYPDGQYLTFGQGGVDDGEDADVILHELGHGIHHWISGLKSSSRQGLGEGSGDYWAMSYSRSLNQWAPNTPEYHWVFNWDGHNPFWPGRVTNYAKKYTANISNTNNIHIDGQIWATTLMRIYDKIGKEKTDRIFLEGLALTNSTANQQTAATAVRQAAIDMVGQFRFTCGDVDIINKEMIATGYTMANYTCTDLAVNDIKKDQIKIYPNPTKDILNITLDANKSSNAIITSAEGRQVMTAPIKNGKNTVNVSSLPKGVYLITAEGISQKFIKE